MIQLTPHMRIFVAIEPADFRRGIDGLAALCRQHLRHNPLSGAVFVFRNRQRTAIKLLTYDGWGFWLCHKRLSEGRFRFWPTAEDQRATTLSVPELQVLLFGGNPDTTDVLPPWKKIE